MFFSTLFTVDVSLGLGLGLGLGFFHCAIDEHGVMPSRPWSEMLLPWKVYPHWDADFCMEDL